MIKEYQRLKEIESNQYNLEWNVKRILTKTNDQIHTDAIKDCILPEKNYDKDKEWIIYAEEGDLLNVALFKCTAKDWREANPDKYSLEELTDQYIGKKGSRKREQFEFDKNSHIKISG